MNGNTEKATGKMLDFLNKTYPKIWRNLEFTHADAAGYWFTFELKNDARRQTWCIRPEELTDGGEKHE